MYQFGNTLNVIIKPTLSCNLRCKYCYYQHTDYGREVMPLETLTRFCDVSFPHFKKVLMVWHGGEPMVCGEDTLSKYIETVYKKSKEYSLLDIQQNIQTNGTLLCDNFVECLKNFNISTGMSYDGLKNEYLRGKTSKTLEGMQLAKQHKLPLRIITVVSGINCGDLINEYENAKKLGIDVKYSPYEDVDSPLEQIKISSDQYVECMERLFDYWIDDKNCCIRVDPFCSMICDYYNGYSTVCTRTFCLKSWIGIHPNGNVYPCGKLTNVEPYGNLNYLNDIREIYTSRSYVNLMEKANIRKQKCLNICDIFQFCKGGCNYDASVTSGIENNGGFDCRIFRSLFKHVTDAVNDRKLFDNFENVKNPILLKHLKRAKLMKIKQ